METAIAMAIILVSIVAVLAAMSVTLTVEKKGFDGFWLPPANNLAKRQFEIYALTYTCVWIAAFAVVIATQAYEQFDENSYMILTGSLAAPFLLQPFLFPMPAERNLPLHLRYSFKANVWIAIFSFIGNYWYTHYFYTVLQARYTFPSHRINDVPYSMFFSTHFYFVTYHTFSNIILRKIETKYAANFMRSVFFWSTIFAFSYFTAFMETLTISAFPYYYFPPEIKSSVYTIGSAFYGLYFIVSFPLFYRLDEKVNVSKNILPHTIEQTIIEVMGGSMIVLCLLDFCRLSLEIPLHIEGKWFELTKPIHPR